MKIVKLIALLVLATAFLAPSCNKEDAMTPSGEVSSTLSDAYTKRLSVVFDSMCNVLQLKGASGAVLVPNVGLWKKAYGESYKGVSIKTDMTMTIGSNTKTYIATLVLKLQEQGKLNINDTIGKWIKNKPFVNGKVTIKQLLNHTSGFGDFSYNPAFIEAIKGDLNRVWKPAEMYPFFQAPYFTPPGSAYRYSDQNTLLVGLIIEAVTNNPVEKSLRELVLAPANLPNTVYYPFEKNNLTIPHSWSADYNEKGVLEDLDKMYGYSRVAFCSADNAAGGMMSTAEENALFWNSLMTGKIISQQSLQMMKEFGQTGAPNSRYGLCLEERSGGYSGRTVYSHNGYVPGSVNDNAYDPISGICITILTNQDKVLDFSKLLEAMHKVTLDYKK